MKAVVLLFIVMITGPVCFGQVHDESFRGNEPAKVQVYPNPAIDYITVKLETPTAHSSKLSLHSIIGNSVELEQEVVDDFEIRVKVKDLAVGYYIIVVSDPQTSARSIHKFLKR
jgi:hypothetical protein